MMYYRSPVAAAANSSDSSSAVSWGWNYSHDHDANYYNNDNLPLIGSRRQVSSSSSSSEEAVERIVKLVSESAVVIFSKSSCCMCHAVKRLLCGMGVNPIVYELDQDPFLGKQIETSLMVLLQQYYSSITHYNNSTTTTSNVPVVFIGGKLVGAMDRVMASHINGTLVPLLKEAGALWL